MKYNILYVDPPWSYLNKKTGGSMKSGSASKYNTIPTNDLCELPIKDIIDKDAVLFLWATVPLLPDAFKVMGAWGFKYKTSLFWRKIMSMGMGYHFRGQVEIVLFGIKGKVKALRCQKSNFMQTRALKHSEKPEEFRQLIELATGKIENPRRLELFGRKLVPTWKVIGNEISGNDIRIDMEELK